MKKYIILFILSIALTGCQKTEDQSELYKSETLSIIKLSERVYQHVSYMKTESFGKVLCNGMIVINNGEAVVFDTPADDATSAELIDQLTETLKSKIVTVIPTHYHTDNLGGLNEFHRRGIPSYAYNETIRITKENGYPVPQHGFDERLELNVGGKIVLAEFLGGGHTVDNTIGYFPYEDIMFGGCLIKNTGSGKGNLEDADVGEWPNTVTRVKAKYPNVKIIIPGHGEVGGAEFLDYTIKLFNENHDAER